MVDFPNPLDRRFELNLDGTWTDITSDVYQRGDIQISRGRSGEGGITEPSRCSLTINNRSGDYSPRNPTGAHFGVLGRNTPLRVVTGPEVEGLWLDGASGSYASTPDAAHLDVTGDIDIRVRVAMDDWTPAAIQDLVSKFAGSGTRSFIFRVGTDGTLGLTFSSDGTAFVDRNSTASVSATDGAEKWVRVTLDVDNGASGHDVKFYTSDDGETWAQLGTTVTTAGTTSIHAGTAALEVGARNGGIQGMLAGIVGYVDIRDVIDGATTDIVADPDFAAQARNDDEFTDTQVGNTWTINGTAALTGPSTIRFTGEVSSWPQRWDPSGSDVWVPIEAAGILRRLGQGAAPLRSALFRGASTLDNAVAYWPCEDGKDATSLASGLAGHPPMTIGGPTRGLAAFEDFKSSDPIPNLGTGWFSGAVPAHADTGQVQMRFLLAVPEDGVTHAADCVLATVLTNGTAARWDLWVESVAGTGAGDLKLTGSDIDGNNIHDTGFINFNVNGKLLWVSIGLEQNGNDIDTEIVTIEPGSTAASVWSSTLLGRTTGTASNAVINTGGADLTDTAIGHVLVQDEVTSLFDLKNQLDAWDGERASRRIERLCDEEGITFPDSWNHALTPAMGPQLPKTLLDLLREAEATDMGILFEQRDALGLDYRQRASLQVEDVTVTPTTGLLPTLELDYSAADLSGIEPVDDDQTTRNDVTVKRDGGSAARATLTTGALSTAAPPDGVGAYDESVTISVESDDDLPDQAGWRLHVGTVDEARYPTLGINLGRDNFTSDDTLTAAAISLDLGDKVTVTNPPAWLPPDDISQLVQGYTETLRHNEWVIDINCAPASPFDVAVYEVSSGPGEARYSSNGSTLDEDLDTTETGVDVATADGPLWSDADQPFDLWIGGERVTVTAVTGSTSPQTFTVTRSVNGVVKTHSSGAEVRLWKPARFAL